MRTLEVLLKRANQQMEALAGAASETLAVRNDVLSRRAAAEAAIQAEAAMIDASPLSGMGFAEYLDRQKQRIAILDGELKQAEEAHAEAKAALMKAFAEVQKLEALVARQKEDARLEALRREQQEFDERSSQTFGR